MKLGLLKRSNEPAKASDPFNWDIDRVFDNFFSWGPLSYEGWNPRVDVTENDTAVVVTAEIPGLSDKEIKVTLEKNLLTISGEKKEEKDVKDEKKHVILSERKYGSFCRSITLPEGIKADAVKAEFKNGLLTIVLPRDESARPKRIEVKVH